MTGEAIGWTGYGPRSIRPFGSPCPRCNLPRSLIILFDGSIRQTCPEHGSRVVHLRDLPPLPCRKCRHVMKPLVSSRRFAYRCEGCFWRIDLRDILRCLS